MWRFASMAHEVSGYLPARSAASSRASWKRFEAGQRLHDDPGALGRVRAVGRALVRLPRELDRPQRLGC